jgi:hypothetical protein
VALDSVAHFTAKFEKFSANDFPVLLGAILHMMKLGTLW